MAWRMYEVGEGTRKGEWERRKGDGTKRNEDRSFGKLEKQWKRGGATEMIALLACTRYSVPLTRLEVPLGEATVTCPKRLPLYARVGTVELRLGMTPHHIALCLREPLTRLRLH